MPGATLETGLEGGQPWTWAQTHYFLIYIPGHEVPRRQPPNKGNAARPQLSLKTEMQSGMPVSGGHWLSLLSQGCGSQELTARQQATEDQSDGAEDGK